MPNTHFNRQSESFCIMFAFLISVKILTEPIEAEDFIVVN